MDKLARDKEREQAFLMQKSSSFSIKVAQQIEHTLRRMRVETIHPVHHHEILRCGIANRFFYGECT